MALEFFFLPWQNLTSRTVVRTAELGVIWERKNVFTEIKCYFCTISLRLLYKYHLLVLSF